MRCGGRRGWPNEKKSISTASLLEVEVIPLLLPVLVEDAVPTSRLVVAEAEVDESGDADVEDVTPACGGGFSKNFQTSHEMAAKPMMAQ